VRGPEDEGTSPTAFGGQPPPNWYPDPQDPARARYWDGINWTENTYPPGGAAGPAYRSLGTLAKTLFVLLVVGFVLGVIVVLSGWVELDLLGRIVADPGSVSTAEAEASDQRQALIALVDLLLWLGTAVVFIVWFRRAYRNLPALGVEAPRFSSGWAVGAWFVPFLNLVRPKQIMDDIWQASDPALPARQSGAGIRPPVPFLLTAWWTMFIVTNLLAWYAFTLARDATSPEQLRTASAATFASDILYLPLTALAYQVIARVTRRQEARQRTRAYPPRMVGVVDHIPLPRPTNPGAT
jgi:Domain of unknown function (DUF4328)/Protein of unknown function (DUF2510)